MGLGVFLEASAMACDGVLQAHDRVVSQMWGQIASAIAYFALAWWWLDAGYGVMGVMWANVASRAVRLLVMVPLMLAGTGPWILRPAGREAVPAAYARGLLRLGWPIFLASTFGILYYKIDTPLLRAFADESAVGIYTLGHRALDYLAMVPGLFATALFPTMLRAAEAQGGMERVSERALRYLHLIVLPVTLLFTLAAAPVTMWLAKGETGFADSIVVFRIVIWGMPFLAASNVLNRMLYTAGKERSFIVIALTTLAFNIVANILVIPRWGYFGTSVVVVASQAAQHRAALGVHPPRRPAPAGGAVDRERDRWRWRPPGSAPRASRSWLARDWGTTWTALPVAAGWWPTLAVIALTTLLYLPAMWFTRSITAADLPVLRSLVKR